MGDKFIGAIHGAWEKGGPIGLILGVLGGFAASALGFLLYGTDYGCEPNPLGGNPICPEMSQIVFVFLFMAGAAIGGLVGAAINQRLKART